MKDELRHLESDRRMILDGLASGKIPAKFAVGKKAPNSIIAAVHSLVEDGTLRPTVGKTGPAGYELTPKE